MIIKFLRSSASTPETNLKMCQEDSFESYEDVNMIDAPMSDDIGQGLPYAQSKHDFRKKGKNTREKKIKSILTSKRRSGARSKGCKMQPHFGFMQVAREVYHMVNFTQPTTTQWSTHLLMRGSSIYRSFQSYGIAFLLQSVPQDFLRCFWTEEMLAILSSYYFFEMQVVSNFNVVQRFNDAVAPLMSLYRLVSFKPQNIDVWVCYVLAVKDSVSFVQFTAITYNSLRALGCELLSPHIQKLFADYVNNNLTIQAEGGVFEEFIQYFNTTFDVYNLSKKSPALSLLLRLLTMLVSFGSCHASSLQFTICGVKLFREGFLKQFEKAKPCVLDIFELVGEMAQYFVKIGYLCFKHRSFRPLLFEDKVAYSMADLHVSIVSSWPAIQDMAWEVTPFADDIEFRKQASELISYYKEVYSSLPKTGTHEAAIIQRKWQEIDSMMQTLTRLMLCGELRKAPFGILIHGGSSVGKSTFTSMVSTVAVIAQGGDPRAEMRKVTNPNDEFFSNYTYGTEAIILDDMCNTKMEFTQKSPLEKIIEYINNVPAYPVMADLSSKGKIPLCPKTVIVTTNVDGLNASVYSNEPVSILRRFNVWINIRVRAEFAIDSSINPENFMLDKDKVVAYQKLLEHQGASQEQILMPDIWEIRMWTVKSGNPGAIGGTATIVKVPVVANKDGDAAVLDIVTALDIITRMSKKHGDEQVKVVRDMKSIPEFLSTKMAAEYPHKVVNTPHFVDVQQVRESYAQFKTEVDRYCFAFCGSPVWAAIFDWRNLGWCPIAFMAGPLSICSGLSFAVMSCFAYVRSVKYRKVFDDYYQYCTGDGKYIALGLSSMLLLSLILKYCWNSLKNRVKVTMNPHGNLNPKTMEDLDINSKQTNVWVKPVITPLPTIQKTHVTNDLINVCSSNLVIVVVDRKFVNGFFIKQNFMIIPHHFAKMMDAADSDIIQIISGPATLDGSIRNNHTQTHFYSKSNWCHIPDTDLCVYYVANAMPRKEVLKYFPLARPNTTLPASFVGRRQDATIVRDTALLIHGRQDTGALGCTYDGHSYCFENITTFNGMCTGVWVSDTKPAFIAGFHLGGVAATPRGCSGSVTVTEINDAVSSLLKKNMSFVDIPCEGEFNMEFYKEFENATPQEITTDLSPKHPVNFLPPESNIICYGSNGGTHKYRTKVEYRKLGMEFFEENDWEVTHGKPNMNAPPSWYHFTKNLAEFATVTKGPPAHVLNWAVLDYKLPLLQRLKDLGFGNIRKVKPLNRKENVNGIPGVRFLDALKVSTAAGYPLKGKTLCYIDGEDGERDFVNPAVWAEVERCEYEYSAGRRCYHVFVAHLKDEPVELHKDKVRVFFGNGTVFKLLIRKYWLPVVRLLSELPILSECAVGINSTGFEWEEFFQFVSQHGTDRCVAGDYKGYDQKIFLNVIQSVYTIYVDIAIAIGYSRDEIIIMKSMVADLSLFCVQYYGAIIMMSRGNPSGQNLTSYVNSTANSLNSRCAYYEGHGGCPPPFRQMVNMMTYGDDDVGCVSRQCTWYNAQTKSAVLGKYGILYTPPNKKGEHVPFYQLGSVDFLKRTTKFVEGLDRHLGALSMSSIKKSILCGLPTPHMTNEQIFGDILDNALLEVFPHGREVYEDFRARVVRFVETRKIQRFLRTTHMTYDDRVQAWLSTYVNCEPHIGYQVQSGLLALRLMREMTFSSAKPPWLIKLKPRLY